MKSKCCGAEVCRSHDGRSTFCMKCFADTTESETNHRAQVEDWAADFDSMFPQLAEETHDRGHNGNNREYYWKSRTDDVKEFITNLLKSEIEAARQDQKRIDAEKAIGIAEDEHGRDGDHPWCDSEDPCCMVEKLKQSIISTE